MVQELSRPGNIFLGVVTTPDRVRAVSTIRPVESGYITYASLGQISEAIGPFIVWADLKLRREEGLTTINVGTIVAGYLTGQFHPQFTGRIPLLPGDSLLLAAISNTLVEVYATIRFERA